MAGTFAICANALLRADQISGQSHALGSLALLLTELVVLSTPLLVVAGLDVVGFGVEATAWVLRFIDRRIAQWAVYAGLAALAAWRFRDLAVQTVGDMADLGVAAVLAPVLGAAVLVAALWGYWLVARRLAGRAARNGRR